MLVKRSAILVLSLIAVLVGVLAACAAPAPTPSPTLTPTYTPTSTPTSTALAQIIEGAKKEGTVSIKGLRSGLTPTSIERLAKEIKERFGVELKIDYAPSANYAADLSQALMEHQTGATPTWDILTFTNHIIQANQAGIVEQVDWKSLLLEGTNPEVVQQHPAYRGGIVCYTTHTGLMYNPAKIPADKMPQTLGDMADPKWTGQIAIINGTSMWSVWAFMVGKEKTLATLRGILRNKNKVAGFPQVANFYSIGEVSMAFTLSVYVEEMKMKGMPAAWQHLDFADYRDNVMGVQKRIQHPNAAKLVSLYIASPAGAKWMLEECGAGNVYYSGNPEDDIKSQAESRGLLYINDNTYPPLVDFMQTDEFGQWLKEIDLILKGG